MARLAIVVGLLLIMTLSSGCSQTAQRLPDASPPDALPTPLPPEAAEPGTGVRVARDGLLLKVGPFPSIVARPGWSDDGQVFAFASYDCNWEELWAVDRDGEAVRRLVQAESTPDNYCRLFCVGWLPGRHRLLFAVGGPQGTGPHGGRDGLWVGEVAYPSGEIRDIVFLPVARAALARMPVLTADGSSLIVEQAPDLWRIDLDTGQVLSLASDIWEPSGPYFLQYCPAGRYRVTNLGRSPVVIHDLKTAERLEIEVPGPVGVFLCEWGPGDLVTVSLADPADINAGDNLSWPAGAVALRGYRLPGDLQWELTVPPGRPDYRIGSWAWSESGVLAFTLGPLVPVAGLEGEILRQEARELWLWRGPGSHPQKLASLAGRLETAPWVGRDTGVETVAWTAGDRAVEVWYWMKGDETEREGVRIWLSGETESLSRPVPWRLPSGALVPVGAVGDVSYFTAREADGRSRIVARKPDGETAVVFQGPCFLWDARVEQGALTLVAGEDSLSPAYLYLLIPK